ncbi:MAG: hypothetical protein HYY92_02940 [Parcubacteria group bacterium]|nr:hypothetical protein [Parcubacteria group bacterium]
MDNETPILNRGKRPVPIVVLIVILLVLGAGFLYWSQREKGAVGAAKDVSAAVPEIKTNPGQEVPEVNPLDLANPFKYTNPLR